MNPRNLGNFFKSKFGLFVVFVVVPPPAEKTVDAVTNDDVTW